MGHPVAAGIRLSAFSTVRAISDSAGTASPALLSSAMSQQRVCKLGGHAIMPGSNLQHWIVLR